MDPTLKSFGFVERGKTLTTLYLTPQTLPSLAQPNKI